MTLKCENLIFTVMTWQETREYVSQLRRNGWNVESTPVGYVCHEVTRYGLALVFSARKCGKVYHVSINIDFADTGRLLSEMVH